MVVLSTGEDAIERLTSFARDRQLHASHFTAIGAFSGAIVGYFDWEKKDYRKIPITEQVEVLSLVGDVTAGDKGPKVHAHVVLGKSDGTACGGHLLSGNVRPTLEIVLTETPAYLRRRFDPESGLALIDPTA
jgi:predicted DNA-binding protein with PD1-like motif